MKPNVSKTVTSDINLADLRAFGLVVDLGSLTAAAKRLGESKGSISRRLSRLESSVGVALLRRSPRLVQPTEEGLLYRGRLNQALELLDEATAALQEPNTAPKGHLRVTAPQDFGVAFAPLMTSFLEQYPGITLEMILTDQNLDFDLDQIDVALRIATKLKDSSLVAKKLFDLEHLRMFATPEYLQKNGTPTRPEELAGHRFLLMRVLGGQMTLGLRHPKRGEKSQLTISAALSASDGNFLREAALASAGILLAPSVFLRRDIESGRLVPLLPEYQIDQSASLYLLYQPRQILPQKIRVFCDFVIEKTAERCKIDIEAQKKSRKVASR